jgi:enamine deaminase RidA (YjgF/YER057c/UK114 family)
MPRVVNPHAIAAPASRYAHGIIHSARARRLVISGQVGIRVDGSIGEGLAEQMEICWDNIFAILADSGMSVADLVKITVFTTVPGSVSLYRAMRDRKLGGHLAAATYLEVAGLASPAFLVEIEAEAVCEEADGVFLEMPQADETFTSGSLDPARSRVSGNDSP